MAIALVALALLFNFLNGFHDASNIVATMIASRSISPRVALMMTALAEFSAPLIFGSAVATTIGKEIIHPEAATLEVILAALISAIVWNLLTWLLGIPSSSSHALIGGMVGAAVAGVGWGVVSLAGVLKVVAALLISPLLGFVFGFLLNRLVYYLARKSSMKINLFFKRCQFITGLGLGLSHGSNDAQKTIGIITLGLLTGGWIDHFEAPLWVILASGAAIALGSASGGWRLIKTLGGKFYKIRPVDAFCSQFSSAGVILGAALVGGPVSTTQVVSSAILGVGSAQRWSKVRWNVAGNIAAAWLLTMPANGLLAYGLYLGLHFILP